MNPSEFIGRASDRLASALATLDPATPVPSCPGWVARDLMVHLTHVQHFWATVLGEDLRTGGDVRHLEENPPELPESIDEILPIRAPATAEPTVVVTGEPDDVARWPWGRGGEVEISGEEAGRDVIGALIDAGIQ